MQLIHADANRYYHTLAKTIKYRLLSDLEDEVSVGRLRVEHGEGELVGDLLAVELLRVLEQVDEGVHLHRIVGLEPDWWFCICSSPTSSSVFMS